MCEQSWLYSFTWVEKNGQTEMAKPERGLCVSSAIAVNNSVSFEYDCVQKCNSKSKVYEPSVGSPSNVAVVQGSVHFTRQIGLRVSTPGRSCCKHGKPHLVPSQALHREIERGNSSLPS